MTRSALRAAAHAISVAAAACAGLALAAVPAAATKIERVVSPMGIEAWLVRETSVPLIAVDFAFVGGANDDPSDLPGVADTVAALLGEGAGDLDAKAFHERLDEHAVEITFAAGRDHLHGSLRALRDNRDIAVDLLRQALTAARFDADAIERVRTQALSALRRDSTNPYEIASRRWWATAFPDHPYGRPSRGTPESLARIGADDLRAYVHRVLARSNLKIAVVGDIDAAGVASLIDRAFGGLPAGAELQPVPATVPQGLDRRIVVDLDVPQAMVVFGGAGIARRDPDFMAGYLVNYILGGGGSLSSRLYAEIREKRGLAYLIRTNLLPLGRAAVFIGVTGTRGDRTGETLEVLAKEIARFADTGPSEDELAGAKSFLEESYALAFDTSSKIAGQLVQIQLDDLGIDYIDRRNSLFEAVTLADAKRVARRIFGGPFLTTIVGRPQGVTSKEPGG